MPKSNRKEAPERKEKAPRKQSIAVNILLLLISLSLVLGLFEWYFRSQYKDILYKTGYQRYREWAEEYRPVNLNDYVPRPDKLTILGLGDSFTYGLGVRDEDEIFLSIVESSLQEQRTVPVTVINAGQGADNSAEYLHKLRLLTVEWQNTLLPGWVPDLVSLNIFINDPEIKQEGVLPIVPGWHPLPFIGEYIIMRSYLYLFIYHKFNRTVEAFGLKRSYTDHLRELYDPEKENWKRFVANITEIVNLCREKRMPLAVTVLPILADHKNYPYDFAHDALHDLLKQLDVKYIDMRQILEDRNSRDLWINPFDAHPNEQAHRLFGNLLTRFIETNALLPVYTPDDARTLQEDYHSRYNSGLDDDQTVMRIMHYSWLAGDTGTALQYAKILRTRYPENRLLGQFIELLTRN